MDRFVIGALFWCVLLIDTFNVFDSAPDRWIARHLFFLTGMALALGLYRYVENEKEKDRLNERLQRIAESADSTRQIVFMEISQLRARLDDLSPVAD
ncbi:MAG TPA: hypothetical protein VGB82_23875 [Alphaproteobacteria bacterium]